MDNIDIIQPQLIILQGLPASGKSTRAKELTEQGYTRVNKDLLRTMLHFDEFSRRNEAITHNMSYLIVENLLKSGVKVVIDDTNLNPKTLNKWTHLADSLLIPYKVETMKTHWLTCVERDMARDKQVGKDVILSMALRYQGALDGKEVIICDIDGTIASVEHRRGYLVGDRKDWKGFFSNMQYDPFRKEVWKQVLEEKKKHNASVVFVSGRPEDYRDVTSKWLQDNTEYSGPLLMRSKGDSRDDTVVKKEIYERYLANTKVVKVFDDRPKVIRMWREIGLDVVDVGDGIEF